MLRVLQAQQEIQVLKVLKARPQVRVVKLEHKVPKVLKEEVRVLKVLEDS